MAKIKEQVRIRTKKLKNGNRSIYLDTYIDGQRVYEFLKLYLIPEHNKYDKEINRQTLQLANSIKAKKIIEIQNNEFGFNNHNSKIPFFPYLFDFCRSITDNMDNYKGGKTIADCTAKYLRSYEPRENITLQQITAKWINGFVKYLSSDVYVMQSKDCKVKNKKPLSPNTIVIYYSVLNACLNQAVRDGYISKNPTSEIRAPRMEETTRMYLTIDELRLLSATDCRRDDVRRAFLFSCLTGIRRVDIKRIRWCDIHKQGKYTRIVFRQQKTSGQEYLDISEQATSLIGENDDGNSNDYVFSLPANNTVNSTLNQWVKTAGINKHITFHCARHTFATMMLDIGTDIYTVSKLLGHRELSTTQIYAKVMDKNKQKAVSNIPNILEKQ